MILNLNKIRTIFYIISYRCKHYIATGFVGKIGYKNLVCRQHFILSEPERDRERERERERDRQTDRHTELQR